MQIFQLGHLPQAVTQQSWLLCLEMLPFLTCGSRFATAEEEKGSGVQGILWASLEVSSIIPAYLPPAGISFRAPFV